MMGKKLKAGIAGIALTLWCPFVWAVTLLDSKNHEVDPSQWRNKWVIINYWASWCEACGQEIPELNQFYHRHKEQVIMYGVNYDNLPLEQLQTVIGQMKIEFPVLKTDPAKLFNLPNLNVLPTTFILDPQGKLAKQLIGPQNAQDLENIVHVSH
jgi:thiol-disulfide isomerase/thioredoxin